MKSFKERCQEECTQDVVFLLRRKKYICYGLPDEFDFEDGMIYNYHGANGKIEEFTLEEVYKENWRYGDFDNQCVNLEFIVESVWLSREEAEEFVQKHIYNYREGYDVYGVPSKGELVSIIKESEIKNV